MPKRPVKGGPVDRVMESGKKTKTSIVIGDDLLQRLKFAALEERTDVSALLCTLAEEYLKRRKGGR
jgi:hypothetical protein